MKKILKSYINASLIYAILALIGGVYYREFTKFMGYTGKTMLSVVHTHYFLLGMVFFLLLLVLEKCFAFGNEKTEKLVIAYNSGLNLTVLMMLVRGTLQVLGTSLNNVVNASISGIAGIGHIVLGVSLFMILLEIRKAISSQKKQA